jgi:TonB family protein
VAAAGTHGYSTLEIAFEPGRQTRSRGPSFAVAEPSKPERRAPLRGAGCKPARKCRALHLRIKGMRPRGPRGLDDGPANTGVHSRPRFAFPDFLFEDAIPRRVYDCKRGLEMALKNYPGRPTFGLLPEPEGRTGSFVTSMVVNGVIVAIVLIVSLLVKPVIQEHEFEQTELIFPTTPPPPPPVKIKIPPPPPVKDMPKPPVLELEEPKTQMPKPEPNPVQLEAKINLPTIKAAKPQIILAPQPKAALTAAAMPAQNNLAKPSTAPVHLGGSFGVTPNPNATRPATLAAIGNLYGGMNGPAVAPHGVVVSTGIGNGLKSGSNAGTVGRVASAGIPGGTGTTTGSYSNARVASAGIPAAAAAIMPQMAVPTAPISTQAEVSIPKPAYTDEAKQMKIQGAVVLRVTFYANGHIQVLGVLRGLGHGLDEKAVGAVQQGRVIRPAMVNGKSLDSTTNITITFQLA